MPPFAILPPIEPMLSKVAEEIPRTAGFLFEPKWDGFRAIVFRATDDLFIQSRDLKPLDRYFPDLHGSLSAALPAGCVVDGEIVIATPAGLNFDLLQLRLHPAASRVAKLAQETPASFVAFDLLAAAGKDIRSLPFEKRRAQLEALLKKVAAPVHVTPMTRDRDVAVEWLERFEGAGLDGVMAKPADGRYEPGRRAMFKIKHSRTADCVVAGFRWHKNGPGTLVGSLLLGLFDKKKTLQHVGVASAFTAERRRELAALLEPLRRNAMKEHPWREWAGAGGEAQRMPGGQSRWSAGKDLSWEPVRIRLVCEVKYDHMQGDRFRHAAIFVRWRADKEPGDCTYDQLEVTTPYELDKIFKE
ncbi:MAG TPA: ATP-dependent DNA ligase [Vicinamibacterales bacterium]|nr:ATP-dependent DNA ligase [Vicinamibacterales bacterium]